MADSYDSVAYLMPKTKNPKAKQTKKNEMFVNQPNFMEMGGFTGPSKLHRTGESSSMRLEKAPSSKIGKPV